MESLEIAMIKPQDLTFKASICRKCRPLRMFLGKEWSRVVSFYGKITGGVFRCDIWATEAAALVLSAVVIALIVITLYKSDGQPISSSGAPITLNALISLFVTILYVLLTSPISKSVQQLRWNHFHRSRPLSDFQSYERVAYSTFSAAKVFKTPAFLIIAITAIGPSVQQVLGIVEVSVATSVDAMLPVLRGKNNATFYNQEIITGQMSVGANPAIYAGGFASVVSNFSVPTSCASGNCTWNDYASLGLRCEVKNISDQFQQEDPGVVERRLSNITALYQNKSLDQLVNNNYTTMQANTSEDPGPIWNCCGSNNLNGVLMDLAFSCEENNYPYFDLNLTAFQVTVLDSNATASRLRIVYQEMRVRGVMGHHGFDKASVSYGMTLAWEFFFDIVVQPLRGRQENGVFTEENSAEAIPFNGSPCRASDQDTPCKLNYTWNDSEFWVYVADATQTIVALENSTTGWSYDYTLQVAPENDEKLVAAGKAQAPSSIATASSWDTGSSAESILSGTLFWMAQSEAGSIIAEADSNVLPARLTVPDAMGNIARSVTLWMRTSNNQTVAGIVSSTRTVYTIHWRWISVPVVLLVLTAALLAATAWDTHRKNLPAWTDSTLAVMVHGIADEQTREDLAGIQTVEELRSACKEITVKLGGVNLSLELA